MTLPEPTVFVVDDDPAVCDSLGWLISSVGLAVESFTSAREFLEAAPADQPGCVIVDVRMPGMSGLQLQEELARDFPHLAVIIVTAHADVPMAVRAMKAGAIDLVEKPFNDQQLLELVHKAVEKSAHTMRFDEGRRDIRNRYDSLSQRERQVLEGIMAGYPNKTIAADLGLSQKTIEIHRAKVMAKMHAKTFAELVEMVTKSRLTKENP